jgi:hypothetical protein
MPSVIVAVSCVNRSSPFLRRFVMLRFLQVTLRVFFEEQLRYSVGYWRLPAHTDLDGALEARAGVKLAMSGWLDWFDDVYGSKQPFGVSIDVCVFWLPDSVARYLLALIDPVPEGSPLRFQWRGEWERGERDGKE